MRSSLISFWSLINFTFPARLVLITLFKMQFFSYTLPFFFLFFPCFIFSVKPSPFWHIFYLFSLLCNFNSMRVDILFYLFFLFTISPVSNIHYAFGKWMAEWRNVKWCEHAVVGWKWVNGEMFLPPQIIKSDARDTSVRLFPMAGLHFLSLSS